MGSPSVGFYNSIKLLNFAHIEGQHYANTIDVNESISRKGGIDPDYLEEQFEYVKIDEYFPKTILNNLDRWRDYIIPDATVSVRDLLPAQDIEEIYK